MKMRFSLFILLMALTAPQSADAQVEPTKSKGKALLLNLALPGLGHRYLADGNWTSRAVFFTTADATLWAGLVGTQWRRQNLEGSYQTLAASAAGAETAGKSRAFYLRMATYRSSSEFYDVLLRNRQWDQLEDAQASTNAFNWTNDADWLAYRNLREDVETLRRQRPLLVALLVANRLLAGILTLTYKTDSPKTQLAFQAPPHPGASPLFSVAYRW